MTTRFPRYYDLQHNGRSCFGEAIDEATTVFQVRLWDRDGKLDEITVLDERGHSYDTLDISLFGKFTVES